MPNLQCKPELAIIAYDNLALRGSVRAACPQAPKGLRSTYGTFIHPRKHPLSGLFLRNRGQPTIWRQSWLGSWVGVFGHGLWCCPSSVGCLWCSWLGFGFGLLLGRVWFRGRPACPPPFPVPARGVGVCAGPGSRLCPALLGWVVGVCFFFFALWFFLFFFFFFSGLCGPCPSIPFLSGWAGGSLFFFFFFFPCPFSPWSAVTGLVLPVLGGWSPCASVGVLFFFFVAFWGGLGRLWWCWRAVWRLWAVFVPFPLPPSFFFGGGGGLPVPPSAFPGLAHALACIQCCLPGCCLQLRSVWPRSGPMGRVGFVHGGLGAPSC